MSIAGAQRREGYAMADMESYLQFLTFIDSNPPILEPASRCVPLSLLHSCHYLILMGLSHGALQGEGFLQFIASRGAGDSIWFLQRLTFNSFPLFSFLSGII